MAKELNLAQQHVDSLRGKLANLENQLQELSSYAIENEMISLDVMHWCTQMLAQNDPQKLPQLAKDTLEDIFEDMKVVIKLWDVDLPSDSVFLNTDEALKEKVEQMQAVYQGAHYDAQIQALFEYAPGSVAVLPLLKGEKNFGVLVFASQDKQHFHEDMGQGFLLILSALASASFSRLLVVNEVDA